MRAFGLALGLSLVSGCYCSHERAPSEEDAGPDAGADAPAELDAGSDGGPDGGPIGERYWVPAPADVELLVERCTHREGASPIFRIRVTASACDEPANVRFSIDPGAQTVTLDPVVWRPVGGPPCPPSAVTWERDVVLRSVWLAAGSWTLRLADGSASLPFTVFPGPPELPCTDCVATGEPCVVDEECVGAATCIAMRGDAVCGSVCGTPCQPFPDAAGASDLHCTQLLGTAATCDLDPSFGRLCRPATLDLCPPCEPGTSCRSDADALSHCEWSLSPWDAGPRCTSDADCVPGISCVDLGGGRECRIRCRGDHDCPTPAGDCHASELVCEIPEI